MVKTDILSSAESIGFNTGERAHTLAMCHISSQSKNVQLLKHIVSYFCHQRTGSCLQLCTGDSGGAGRSQRDTAQHWAVI